MSPILARPDPAAQADPGIIYTERMSRVDGCPECVFNTEAPRCVVLLAIGYRCGYLCTDCGHAWTTDWRDR